MDKRDMTAAVIDNISRLVIGSSMLATMLIAPNALLLFDKPVQKYMNTLDTRSRERELRRILAYMKNRELIADNYQHGLQITRKGQKRLQKRNFDTLTIPKPTTWDKHWRMVFFDIPEKYKLGRNALNIKLRSLGFKPLQKSVWVYPYPCRDEIGIVCAKYDLTKYVTYLEANDIDNQAALLKRFSSLI